MYSEKPFSCGIQSESIMTSFLISSSSSLPSNCYLCQPTFRVMVLSRHHKLTRVDTVTSAICRGAFTRCSRVPVMLDVRGCAQSGEATYRQGNTGGTLHISISPTPSTF